VDQEDSIDNHAIVTMWCGHKHDDKFSRCEIQEVKRQLRVQETRIMANKNAIASLEPEAILGNILKERETAIIMETTYFQANEIQELSENRLLKQVVVELMSFQEHGLESYAFTRGLKCKERWCFDSTTSTNVSHGHN
jgi:hypothetical protein